MGGAGEKCSSVNIHKRSMADKEPDAPHTGGLSIHGMGSLIMERRCVHIIKRSKEIHLNVKTNEINIVTGGIGLSRGPVCIKCEATDKNFDPAPTEPVTNDIHPNPIKE